MSDYRLGKDDWIIRVADGAFIPNDPANRDRIAYEEWLSAGGVPDPCEELPTTIEPEAK